MTMHLMGPAYSNTRNVRKKPRMTKANLARWTQ